MLLVLNTIHNARKIDEIKYLLDKIYEIDIKKKENANPSE